MGTGVDIFGPGLRIGEQLRKFPSVSQVDTYRKMPSIEEDSMSMLSDDAINLTKIAGIKIGGNSHQGRSNTFPPHKIQNVLICFESLTKFNELGKNNKV